jgi:hypothetical protein
MTKLRSGMYANHGRKTRITALLEQLDVPPHPEPVSIPWHIRMLERSGVNPLTCPCCGLGQMVLIERTRGPASTLAGRKEVLLE